MGRGTRGVVVVEEEEEERGWVWGGVAYFHGPREGVDDLLCEEVVVDEDLVAMLGAEFEGNADYFCGFAGGFVDDAFGYVFHYGGHCGGLGWWLTIAVVYEDGGFELQSTRKRFAKCAKTGESWNADYSAMPSSPQC